MKRKFFLLVFVAAFTGNLKVSAQIKNIVFVHGAFADGSGWRKVYNILKDRGYNVSIVGNPNTGIEDDLMATQRVLDRQDGPVILVGHSYGGAIITIAGNSPKVAGLVYVAAFAPDDGESLEKLLSGYPTDPLNGILAPDKDGYVWFDTAKYHTGFCADIPKKEADFMAASQVPIAATAFGYVFKNIAWKSKPSWHIIATEDHAIPVALERKMAKRTRGFVKEIKGSHAIFISRAKEVADMIDKAAIEAATFKISKN